MFFSTNEIVDTQFLFIQTFHNSLFDASWRIVDVNGRADDRAPKGAVVVSVFATAMELAAQRGGMSASPATVSIRDHLEAGEELGIIGSQVGGYGRGRGPRKE